VFANQGSLGWLCEHSHYCLRLLSRVHLARRHLAQYPKSRTDSPLTGLVDQLLLGYGLLGRVRARAKEDNPEKRPHFLGTKCVYIHLLFLLHGHLLCVHAPNTHNLRPKFETSLSHTLSTMVQVDRESMSERWNMKGQETTGTICRVA
jgi:hypothetical protein